MTIKSRNSKMSVNGLRNQKSLIVVVSMTVLVFLIICGSRIDLAGLLGWRPEGSRSIFYDWFETSGLSHELVERQPTKIRPKQRKLIKFDKGHIDKCFKIDMNTKFDTFDSSFCIHMLKIANISSELKVAGLSLTEQCLRLLIGNELPEKGLAGRKSIVKTHYGLRFPTREGDDEGTFMEVHRDQTLASLGELGLSLKTPIGFGGDSHTLRDVIRDSMANFHLKQEELSWTAAAYALYLPPIDRWQNKFGETYTFDDIVCELIQRPLTEGSCGGVHTLLSLTFLEKADDLHPVLSHSKRMMLKKFLRSCLTEAVRVQRPDGSWPASWNYELSKSNNAGPPIPDMIDRDNLLITGHLAEWFLYADPHEQGRDLSDSLFRAGKWLAKKLEVMENDDQEGYFCPVVHAFCVLKLIGFEEMDVSLSYRDLPDGDRNGDHR